MVVLILSCPATYCNVNGSVWSVYPALQAPVDDKFAFARDIRVLESRGLGQDEGPGGAAIDSALRQFSVPVEWQ